jgi:hypothetical protein
VNARKPAIDPSIARCVAVTQAYRRHAGSTAQHEAAASELGLDEATFAAWLEEARRSGWLEPNE